MTTYQPTTQFNDASYERPSGPPKLYGGFSRESWIQFGVMAVLIFLTYRFSIYRLWLKTNPISGEANWSHSICVPIIGLYYLYLNRDELLKKPVRTAWSGLVILVAGLATFAYGIWPGQNDFLKDFGLVVTIFGTVLLLCGWRVMLIAWFPILFIIAALPWPPLLYSRVAYPLQELAAQVAVFTLNVSGVYAQQAGSKIFIGDGMSRPLRTLNVAEACAGMRSLMTFISVAAAVAFLSQRPLWQKLIITASAVPIAIFCNVCRVAGQGLLDTYVSPELSESFAHQFVGMIMLVPAFFLILLVGWFLDQLFVEEADDVAKPATTQPVAKAPQAAPRSVPSMFRPAFVVAFVVLLTAAVGLNAATTYMKISFRKLPVPLQQDLEIVPAKLGPWVQVSADEALNPEMEHALETDKYIFRDYVDSRLLSREVLTSFEGKKAGERKQLFMQIMSQQPKACISVSATYYTGKADTVAHVPDRCYIADGFEPTTQDYRQLAVLKDRPGNQKFRYIDFDDATPGRSSVRRNVGYFFQCNGKYLESPIAVRIALQDLFERHGYYAKVELMTMIKDNESPAVVMNDFLTYALPEIEKCLPDWEKFKQETAADSSKAAK